MAPQYLSCRRAPTHETRDEAAVNAHARAAAEVNSAAAAAPAGTGQWAAGGGDGQRSQVVSCRSCSARCDGNTGSSAGNLGPEGKLHSEFHSDLQHCYIVCSSLPSDE